jgi:hypothetical protein
MRGALWGHEHLDVTSQVEAGIALAAGKGVRGNDSIREHVVRSKMCKRMSRSRQDQGKVRESDFYYVMPLKHEVSSYEDECKEGRKFTVN